MKLCAAPDCSNGVARPERASGWSADYCWTHVSRLRRGQSLGAEVRPHGQSPRERLHEAMLEYLDLRPTDDDGWGRAWDRVRKAAIAYAESVEEDARYAARHGTKPNQYTRLRRKQK